VGAPITVDVPDPHGHRGVNAFPPTPFRPIAGAVLALATAWGTLAHAATGTLTLQPSGTTVDDTYVEEDHANENNGDKSDMRLKASVAAQNRHLFVRIPLSGLANRTVLRAWLDLRQSAGSSGTPIEARLYPLTESWAEMVATWDTRDRLLLLNTPWATPGGTHGPYWSDRALVSSATNNGVVRWQVGPIVQAWNSGALPNHGFLLAPVRTGATREVEFRTSDEGTASERPRLVIDWTDEPPAIRSGWAEVQPRAVRVGSTGASFTAWLDVDATGTTPSGGATGFDALLVQHGGGLRITSVTRFVVAGSSIPVNLVSWTDDGGSVTFRFPRVSVAGQVQLDFIADVLAPASTTGLGLPMSVDDSSTPGPGFQQLWPGDADRVAGNGDDWILTISDQPPVAIDLTPNAATLVNRTCLALSVVGRDALGNSFAVAPDSIVVLPRTSGTVGAGPTFCATASGTVRLVAWLGAMRDTSTLTVLPEQLTQILSVTLRGLDLSPRTSMAPGETLLVDVSLRDGDGLQDVGRIDFDVRHPGAAAAPLGAPYGATFHWQRGGGWTLDTPLGTSWALVPALCSFDEASVSTSPSPARLAFVVGRVARASSSGEWSIRATATSATPASSAESTLAGLPMAASFTVTALDSLAAFSPGLPGATGLPLVEPEAGRVAAAIRANTSVDVQASATSLAGVTTTSDTLFIGPSDHPLAWSLTADPGAGGRLDGGWTTLATLAPQEDEADLPLDLHLWLDHGAALPAQDYRGHIGLRLSGGSPAATSAEAPVATLASVVTAGLAAQLALSEITPHVVTAGTPAASLGVWVKPLIQGSDTGVDRIRVGIPAGYGPPSVTAVTVAGSPVGFEDHSVAGLAEVRLDTRVVATQVIHLSMALDAPTAADSIGATFHVSIDDSATAVPPQAATEGDANGLSDGNTAVVAVAPGPLASLAISPAAATMFPDSTLAFGANPQDAFGNRVAWTPAWRVEGGIGTIGTTTGQFTATAAGTGRVIAQGSGVADTADVQVLPARAIRVRSVTGPAAVHQGQAGVPFTVRLENLAPTAVALDTLRLSFGRAVDGDADADFTIVSAPAAGVVAPPGAVTTFGFVADVSTDALAAPLAVHASASGVESGSGLRLRDGAADTVLALAVVPGGIDVTVSQLAAPVRPASDAGLLTLAVHNRYPVSRELRSLVLANRTVGPGDAERLDEELGRLRLVADDGDAVFEEGADTVLTTTSALSGVVAFAPLSAVIPAGATRTFYVRSVLPVSMRDGDVLDLEVAAAADAGFEQPVVFRNAWPAAAPGGATVDGMVAAAIAIAPVGPAAVHPGEADRLALDFTVPANGYEPDVLQRLGLVNLGTAAPGTDIERLRAWADDGDGTFSPAGDVPLGTLAHVGGGRWQLGGLALAVPAEGRRLFVSADLAPGATHLMTLALAVPAGGDPGLGMASGNSGPLDQATDPPGGLVISDLDRVTVAALPAAGGTARPGERGRILLRLLLSNNYAEPRTLTTLVLDDRTAGPGTQAERDDEVRLLTLREDGNGNGLVDDDLTDPVLATGFFEAGAASFTGLSLVLPALGARQLLATADLSLGGARDGDAIGAVVEDATGVGFAEPTTTSANWPLDSGARWTVDGSVAAQFTLFATPGATLGPGDGPHLALDFAVPGNGYASDVLRGIRLRNLGTAQAGDFGAVQLWRDGGDGTFTAAGDDRLLGSLTFSGAEWTSPLLAESVPAAGARCFVSITVSGAPAESTTVLFEIPRDGIEFDSANDGPQDAALAGSDVLLISSAPILATLEVPAASTVGQVVSVRMVVRNAGAETVRGLAPGPLALSGSGGLAPLSGPVPASLDLAPAASDTFLWTWRADAVGEARFTAGASGLGDPSGLVRSAPRAASNLHRVYLAATELGLSAVQTMPARVNRGQTNVVPMSLTLAHPGGAEASDVRIERLRVRLEQESGAPIVPASLLSRVVVNEGTNVYLTRTTLETSGAEMDLAFATTATVTGTQPTTLNLRLDVSDTTTVPSFRLVIADSVAIVAFDQTSGAPVVVRLGSGSWPVRSSAAQVVQEASHLEIHATAQDTVRTGRGVAGVVLARLRLENPGVTGITSAVRVAGFAAGLLDSAGIADPDPGRRITALRLVAGSQVLGSRPVAPGDAPDLAVPLSPPLLLQAGGPLDVALLADLRADAPIGRFGARLMDSSQVDARDANTLAPIPVVYVPDTLRGGPVTIEAPAESAVVLGTRRMPAAVAIGARNVRVLSAVVRHPGTPGTARLRLEGLALQCLDDLRRTVAPASVLDRIRLSWNGVELAAVTGLPAGPDMVDVALPGPRLEPGDSAVIDVDVDVSASAAAGYLELVAPDAHLAFRDDATGAAAAPATRPGWTLPLQSGIGRLVSPARELSVGLASRMPPTLAADGQPVAAARLALRNTDHQGTGSIAIDHLVVRASDRDFAALPIGAAATRVQAWLQGTLWAESAPLAPDSATAALVAAVPLDLPIDATATLEIRLLTRSGASVPGVRVGFEAADIGVVQPASALLAIAVRPEPGAGFPMWSEAGSLAGANLTSSYSNYPNPFAAGREATTIEYYLPSPARVSLRILTARGEPVARLLDGAARGAGMQSIDSWDGRNGQGQVVYNGVYVAELEVRFDDGVVRQLRRKVAVVR